MMHPRDMNGPHGMHPRDMHPGDLPHPRDMPHSRDVRPRGESNWDRLTRRARAKVSAGLSKGPSAGSVATLKGASPATVSIALMRLPRSATGWKSCSRRSLTTATSTRWTRTALATSMATSMATLTVSTRTESMHHPRDSKHALCPLSIMHTTQSR